jgi:hypothetical protein
MFLLLKLLSSRSQAWRRRASPDGIPNPQANAGARIRNAMITLSDWNYTSKHRTAPKKDQQFSI